MLHIGCAVCNSHAVSDTWHAYLTPPPCLLIPAHPAGSDGSSIGDRIWPAADRIPNCRRGRIAENALGPASRSSPPSEHFNGWMNSDGHRRNILNPAFTHMGVALAGSGNGVYATQVFAECK